VLDTEADIAGRMPEEVLEDAVESVDLPEAEFDDPGEGRSLVDDASG
jgi:hypothetical protein